MTAKKEWTSAKIRQSFIDFFVQRGHTVVPSASLVPVDDPTLLFTNAGMNQFKDVFLAVGTRPYSRAVDTQKCMRVSGKHNDLEDVGRDTYHHTFFEMLGNWSFGDYYKKEAIGWAWELLTKVWGLPKDRLWATCFEDDEGDLGRDEETAGFWRSETDIDPARILFFGRKDNFWEMGDTGPCGPCSEIHYDRGQEFCDVDDPAHVCAVNGECARYLELWNLVFIQYNNKGRGVLEPLPSRHVDTGAGFDRLVTVLQGVDSNYKTDLFAPMLDCVQTLSGHSDQERERNIVSYRVIADHSRAATFLIGDGVIPGNEGRNYVLRMILRRAIRFGRELGLTEPFMDQVAQTVVDKMGSVFPELETRRAFILATIAQEEQRFLRTLDMGLARLDEILDAVRERGETVVSGEEAFRLYDTFGLPLEITLEITRAMSKETSLTVDEAGYRQALEAQRARARSTDTFEAMDEGRLRVYQELLERLQGDSALDTAGVAHDPYSSPRMATTVAAVLRDGEAAMVQAGDRVEVILAATSFYFESGGQVSDVGRIVAATDEGSSAPWEIVVEDVQRPVEGLIVHVGRVVAGEPRPGDGAWAEVDAGRRMDIARNHTATHLLHRELGSVLGGHVQQAGSLVAPDRLRFDYTHSIPLRQDELGRITRLVNEAILAGYPVTADHTSYRQALDEGVTALFGEKYGDTVRVLRIGPHKAPYSQELCGGTHVDQTGQIGSFHVVAEQGIGADVRRIEAVTGRGAIDWVEQRLRTIAASSAHLSCHPDELEQKIRDTREELEAARREMGGLQRQLARSQFEALLARVQEVQGISLLAAQVDVADREILREMTDWYRERVGSGVVVLGTLIDGQPALVAAVTPDLVERGANASDLVGGVARIVGGGGGGRPTLAQAGGKDAARLGEALQEAPRLLKESLGDRG